MYLLISVPVTEETIRETENPKVSGYLAKSRFSKVDLPAPEGPEITMGRSPVVSVVLVKFDALHFRSCLAMRIVKS